MFEVLVYLYETYYRPDACPDADALIKKLSAVGFEQDEISRALGWLTDLCTTTHTLTSHPVTRAHNGSLGFRIYVEREVEVLGGASIGFIQFLESAKLIDAVQREIVIERALAAGELPISRETLKVIVLMVLWSQGKEPDSLILDELFVDEEDAQDRQLH